jgi:hypothetical protein
MKKKYIIFYFLTLAETNNHTTRQQKQVQMKMNEETALQILNETVQQYKILSPEEKAQLAQASDMKLEDMDKIMEECEKEIKKEFEKLEERKKTQYQQKENFEKTNDLSQQKTQVKQKSKQDIDLEIKNLLELNISIIKEAANIITSISQKIFSDEDFRHTIIKINPEVIKNLSISGYYLNIITSLIKEKIGRNEIQKIEQDEINEIANLAQRTLDSIGERSKHITVKEDTNNDNEIINIYQKYNFKRNTSLESAKKKLQEMINQNREKILTLKQNKEKDEKTTRRTIQQYYFEIEELEKNIEKIEYHNQNDNTKKTTQEKEKYKKMIQKNQNELISILPELLTEIIQKLETFIKKNIPKEFEIGKQIEKKINEQIQVEEKILKQKGSQSSDNWTENIQSNKGRSNEYDYNEYDNNYNNYDNYNDYTDSNNLNNDNDSNNKPEEKNETYSGQSKKDTPLKSFSQKKTGKNIEKTTYSKKEKDNKTENEQEKTIEILENYIIEIYELDEKISSLEKNNKNNENNEKIKETISKIEDSIKKAIKIIPNLKEENLLEKINVPKSKNEIKEEIDLQKKLGETNEKKIIDSIEKEKKMSHIEYIYKYALTKKEAFAPILKELDKKINSFISEEPEWFTKIKKEK